MTPDEQYSREVQQPAVPQRSRLELTARPDLASDHEQSQLASLT
jgi:hypothetical protein